MVLAQNLKSCKIVIFLCALENQIFKQISDIYVSNTMMEGSKIFNSLPYYDSNILFYLRSEK